MINNRMVYHNMLHYEPPKPRGLIRRTAPFSVPVACYFNRFVYSYKVGYAPKVQQRIFRKKLNSATRFVLTPRNAQWSRLSGSDHFLLGEPMYFVAEAEALSSHERLYVHSCFVTPEASPASAPRLPVIANFGCMVESRNNRSRFFPHKNDAVRFSVDAFDIKGASGRLHMHCSMSVGASAPTPTAKACSYDTETRRWVELFGPNSVCDCCDSSCSPEESTATEVIRSTSWTVDPRGKSEAPNKERRTAGDSRETTAGSSERKPWPEDGVGVQEEEEEEEGEERWAIGSAVVESEEKLSEL